VAEDALLRVGRVRVFEAFLEGQMPVVLAGAAWLGLIHLLSEPAPAYAYSPVELWALVGASAALSAWAISRVMFLFGVRQPAKFALAAVAFNLLLIQGLHSLSLSRFDDACTATYGGELLPEEGPGIAAYDRVCVVDRAVDSPALIGTHLRRSWRGAGAFDKAMWAFLLVVSVASSMAFRDRRIRRSRMAVAMIEELAFAQAAGMASVRGERRDNASVLACDNPTLWGEVCGQMYWEGSISPEEPCVRCGFNFHPGEQVRLRVVTLTTDRVDKLNVAERTHPPYRSWTQGQYSPLATKTRLNESGRKRWQELDQPFAFPRHLTVAQALALICDDLPDGLAKKKASRISAWMWFLPPPGHIREHLAVQPGAEYALIAATERLSDALERHRGVPVLQLDVGLMPVQFRFGNRLLSDPSNCLNQNVTLWLPVRSPHDKGEAATRWVPRVESAALRTWLSVVRRSAGTEDRQGLDVMPYIWPKRRAPGRWKDGRGRQVELRNPDPAHVPARLTMVRMSWGADGEPEVHRSLGLLGARLDEWEWLDREQIEQLRQGVVVALPSDFERTLVSVLRPGWEDFAGEVPDEAREGVA
jgi:hypothetical protein